MDPVCVMNCRWTPRTSIEQRTLHIRLYRAHQVIHAHFTAELRTLFLTALAIACWVLISSQFSLIGFHSQLGPTLSIACGLFSFMSYMLFKVNLRKAAEVTSRSPNTATGANGGRTGGISGGGTPPSAAGGSGWGSSAAPQIGRAHV